ncbi:MAG: zinc ABC transporter substrate-binding protein [Planctomycetota bacterium]
MHRRRPLALLRSVAPVTSALAVMLSSCGGASPEATGPDRATIVCTTAMIGDVASEVAGDTCDVVVLFGPDVDPHLFRPTRDDVATLMGADVVLYNGFHLEGHLTETLERVADAGVQVVALAERIVEGDEVIDEGGAPDPHVWMDPSIWKRAAGVVTAVVVEHAGADTEATAGRASALAARLESFDRECEERLAAIPRDRRVLLTAHDAFGYFGRRYDVTVEGIQGVSTASEAGLRAIEDLVALVVERRLPAVFFESTVSERNVKALVEGARAAGHEVRIGGVLHADAPGDAVTYEAMLRHNLETIVAALAPSAEGAAADDAEVRK